jgi:hypothetical protein
MCCVSGSAAGRGRRRDANEKDIVEALRRCGCFVVSLSGDNAPDLLVRWGASFWIPMEVKSTAGKVREGQAAAQYPIVRSVDQALDLIFQWRKKGASS